MWHNACCGYVQCFDDQGEYDRSLQVAADAQAALGMLEVLQAGQHHCEGKLAQARRGNLEQEQRCLLHQQTCPNAVRLLQMHTQKQGKSVFDKKRGFCV